MSTLSGTSATDIIVGTSQADWIQTYGGDDSISSGLGDDRIYGGDGADRIAGEDGNDSVFGGRGADSIDGGVGVDVLTGDYGNDVVYGGAGVDSVYGLSGDDTLYGGTESDTVSGGTGRDRVYGGDGGDVLRGDVIVANQADLKAVGPTNDATLIIVNAAPTPVYAYYVNASGNPVYGGAIPSGGSQSFVTGSGTTWFLVESTTNSYVDVIFGEPNQTFTYTENGGDDTLWGEAGADTVWADTGNDTLHGGTEGDTLYGGVGNDGLSGDEGNDSVYGDAGNDTLFGGTGNDSLQGHDGNDLAYGGEGNDLVAGGIGNDLLHGDAGNDSMTGDAGDDTLWGDDGEDTLGSGGATGAGDDVLYGGTGDDTLTGGDGNDTLSGDAGTDTLRGGAGSDALYGGTGNDTLLVTEADGADALLGGEETGDHDTLSFSSIPVTTGVTVTYTGTDAGTYSYGPGLASGSFQGMEALSGTDHADTINASAATGSETLFGNGGDDSLVGGSGADSLSGGVGSDWIEGNDGSDTLAGDDGADTLFGGSGADNLSGGTEADVLQGGAGDDVIATGIGADLVILGPGHGTDRVTDFDLTDLGECATDQLDVSALLDAQGNPVDAWDVVVTDDGAGHARLTFPGGETVVLDGIAPGQVTGAQALWRLGIPCFTAGTSVAVPGGEAAVERIRPGDLVVTRDCGPQPVRWVAVRRLGPAQFAADDRLLPVRLAPGLLGNERPLLVSPQHGLMLCWEGRERLVRARQLARLKGGQVRVARGVRSATYVHLMFDRHQVLLTDGVWSESFYPGPGAIRSAGAAARAELLRLFPDLADLAAPAYGDPARPYAKWRELPQRFDQLCRPRA